jgi:hypothetical protein
MRHLLFIAILLPLLLLALIDNGASEASTTATLEPKHFLTVEKSMLGFKISYPSDWNITDNDFVISLMLLGYLFLMLCNSYRSSYFQPLHVRVI